MSAGTTNGLPSHLLRGATSPALAPSNDELLALYLQGSNVLCPNCRYCLSKSSAKRCPECGCELYVGLMGKPPHGFAWVMGIVAICVGFVIAALFWIGFFIAWFKGRANPPSTVLAVMGVGLAINLFTILVWSRLYEAMRQVSRNLQAVFALLCWIWAFLPYTIGLYLLM